MSFKAETTDTDLQKWAHKLNIPLVFIGFKDKLPHMPKPGTYIVNLASSTDSSGGTHWISLYLAPNRNSLYYDSFGAPPPDEVLNFARKWTTNAKKIFINPYDIQSLNSGFCGEFSIDFLANIMHNPTREGFIHFLHQYRLFRVQNIKDTNI